MRGTNTDPFAVFHHVRLSSTHQAVVKSRCRPVRAKHLATETQRHGENLMILRGSVSLWRSLRVSQPVKRLLPRAAMLREMSISHGWARSRLGSERS